MVVSVLIIAYFIQLTTCNPYLSSIPNTKIPATTSLATNIRPGENTNQAPPVLQPYNIYSYNIPQDTPFPAQEIKINNPNKAISRTISPLPVPGKEGERESKINTKVDDSNIPKITSDIPTQKYQHKPFSENFNNFRENLLKTLNLGLIDKLPNAPGNVKPSEAGALNEIPKLAVHQILYSTTKGNYSDYVMTYNNIPKGQENKRTVDAILKPASTVTYKDPNIDKAKMSRNGLQIPRVPHNNDVTLFVTENDFGKLNQNTQLTHNIIYDVSKNIDNSIVVPMQQLSVLPSKPQEIALLNLAPAEVNQNLLPPYREEKNVSRALGTPNHNNLNQLNSLALNQQFISDNQALRENLLRMDPNSSFQPAHIYKNGERNVSQKLEVPYYNNFNQSFPRSFNQLIYGNQTLKGDHLEKTNTTYNDVEQIVPQIHHAPPYPHETPSVITNLEINNQPRLGLYNKTGNLPQIMSTAHYNNFNQRFSFAPNSQQLIPPGNKLKERQIEKADPKFNSVEIIESQMPHMPPNPQGFSSQDVNSEIISQPTQVVNNEEGFPSQIFKALYFNNFNQPFLRPFTQKLTPSDQFLKENQFIKADNNSHINVLQTASPHENILQKTNTEFIRQPTQSLSEENKNSQNQITYDQLQFLPIVTLGNPPQTLEVERTQLPLSYEEDESQKSMVPYYNTRDLFNSRLNIQLITDNQQLKENQVEKTTPITSLEINTNCNYSCNNNVIHEIVSQVQPISNLQQNISQIAIPEIVDPPALPDNKEKSKLNNNILKDFVSEEVSHQQSLCELAVQSLENIPEYVQLIDGSENMKTKNAISTPIYNTYEANLRFTPSYKNTFDSLYSLKELNQQGVPYNQMFKDNSQLLKTNKNVQPQETTYGIITDKMLDRKEPRMPLFIPKRYDKYLTHYPNERQDDSQLVKSNPVISPQDMNNNGIPVNINVNQIESQIGSPLASHVNSPTIVSKPFDAKDPQYSTTNVGSVHRSEIQNDLLLSTIIGHQILQNNNNQLVKSYQTSSLEQGTNKTLPNNDDQKQKRYHDLEINIPSQIQNITRDSPTVSVDINQGTVKVRNEIPKPFDGLQPKKAILPPSHDVPQVKNESQDNRMSYYNNFISINSNVLNKQSFDKTQTVKEDPIDELTITNQSTFPSLDIKINIPNTDSNNENNPIEITIGENPDVSCIDNENKFPKIFIDLDNENKKPCKCFNDTQKTNNITTNIDIFIPGFTEKARDLTENNYIISTGSTSTFKEVIPLSDLDNISGYLVDKILSAIQSFLKQTNTNHYITENDFEIVNRDNSFCNCSVYGGLESKLENPLLQINTPEKSNKIRHSTTLLQNKEEVTNPILETNSTKNQCLENNDLKTKIQASMSPKLNLSSSNNNSNKTSEIRPSNANKNEDTLLDQIFQILLPYYYYPDRVSLSSNKTNHTVPMSNLADIKEVINCEISLENYNISAIPSITDKNPEVKKTTGPKPCLSKITVNILPTTEKNTHDNILVFL